MFKMFKRFAEYSQCYPANTVQQSTLKAAGSVFLVIAAFLAVAFLFTLWVSGVLRISEKLV